MMNLIDTHFHLDHYKNYLEMARNITELKQYTICVTNSPGVFGRAKSNYRDKIFKVCYRLSSAGVDIR